MLPKDCWFELEDFTVGVVLYDVAIGTSWRMI